MRPPSQRLALGNPPPDRLALMITRISPGIGADFRFRPGLVTGLQVRTGYVWWQRGHTPRGLRDVGYQSAWIIGAVCPARDTGVALVMTRLDTAAMNQMTLRHH